jgi:hypothetical protein
MLTSLTPELNPSDQVQFLAFHRVGLPAGDYTLDVGQQVTIGTDKPKWFPRTGQTFSVLCERVQLSPQQVHAVFPPPGSRGDFWRDLPHVMLERSTLPWERTAAEGQPTETDPPWLALLVFHGAEAPLPALTRDKRPLGRGVIPLKDLKGPVHGPEYRWPGIKPESGQHDEDQVTVIDVPWKLLREQLPDFDYQLHCRGRLAFLENIKVDLGTVTGQEEDLPGQLRNLLNATASVASQKLTLAEHCRVRATDPANKWRIRDPASKRDFEIWKLESPDAAGNTHALYRVAHEKAIVLGRRLPMPGQRNVIHLVSLEARYTRQGSQPEQYEFAAQGAGDGDLIRLISLFNWEFFCEDPAKDFKGLLENVNLGDAPKGTEDPRPEQPSMLRLPVPDQAKGQDAEPFLRAGFIPLRHHFRQGSRSVSWYHGPLVPAELAGTATDGVAKQVNVAAVALPARAADELLLYDERFGMFDASYAAAWELGRMLTLRNVRVATKLYHWKRDHVHSLHSARHLAEYGFELPVAAGADAADLSLPAEVSGWLNDLTLLRPVPFPYLVPEERLLPLESLRFFTLDRVWLECLRDGAFSIGRVLSADAQRESDARPLAQLPALPTISGLLLRSEVVSGFWPSLRVRAYAEAVPQNDTTPYRDREISKMRGGENKERSKIYPTLSLLRMEQLSKNVMICLFADKRAGGDYSDRTVHMVDFHLKPEMMHFGFDESDQAPAGFERAAAGALGYLIKKLRDADGNELGEHDAVKPAAALSSTRVVDLKKMSSLVKEKLGAATFDPARFALSMIAGTELVRFSRR